MSRSKKEFEPSKSSLKRMSTSPRGWMSNREPLELSRHASPFPCRSIPSSALGRDERKIGRLTVENCENSNRDNPSAASVTQLHGLISRVMDRHCDPCAGRAEPGPGLGTLGFSLFVNMGQLLAGGP